MSIVFFFFDDPIGALCECQRVLRPGGRPAIYTTGPELRARDGSFNRMGNGTENPEVDDTWYIGKVEERSLIS